MFVSLDRTDRRMLSIKLNEENGVSHDKAESDHCPICGRKDRKLQQGLHRCRAKDLQGTPLVSDYHDARRVSYHERLSDGFRMLRMTDGR